MAISFNFDSKNVSPVKETPKKCINCSHLLNCRSLIGRCSYTYDFKFVLNKFFECPQFRNNKNRINRAVHVSFILLVNNDNKVNYVGSGLGMVVNTDMDDDALLSKMYNDKKLMKEIAFKLENEFNYKNVVFEIVITAEKLENSDWTITNNFLPSNYNENVLNDLNNISGSHI